MFKLHTCNFFPSAKRILPYGLMVDSCNQNILYIFSCVLISDPALLDECGLDENTKETLLGIIRRKLTQQAVKIRADIEVACYGYEGIGAVKKSLKAGIACSTEEIPIKINLIAPPLYVMTTQTPERQDGLKALEVAIEKVKEVIVNLGGVFNIQMAVSFSSRFKKLAILTCMNFITENIFFFFQTAQSCYCDG